MRFTFQEHIGSAVSTSNFYSYRSRRHRCLHLSFRPVWYGLPQGRKIVPQRSSIQPPKNSAAPSVDLNPAIDPRVPVVGLLGCCCSAEPRHVWPLPLGSSAETTKHHCHSPPTAMTVGGKQLLELRSALGGGGTREDFLSVLPHTNRPPFKRTSSIPARSCCCFWDEVVASAYS